MFIHMYFQKKRKFTCILKNRHIIVDILEWIRRKFLCDDRCWERRIKNMCLSLLTMSLKYPLLNIQITLIFQKTFLAKIEQQLYLACLIIFTFFFIRTIEHRNRAYLHTWIWGHIPSSSSPLLTKRLF